MCTVPIAGEDTALAQHLLQVSPALRAQTQGSSQPQPERGAAGVSCELGPGHTLSHVSGGVSTPVLSRIAKLDRIQNIFGIY